MKSRFIFDKVRKSAQKHNQIVVQGFCGKELLHECDVRVILSSGKKEKNLNHEVKETNIPVLRHFEFRGKDICRMVSFLVDVPGHIPNGAKMRIVLDYNKEQRTIYKCSGAKINKIKTRINSGINSVYEKDGAVTITGWVIEQEPVIFQLYSDDEMVKDIVVERKSRTDITGEFIEYNADKNVGFSITGKCGRKNAVLKMQVGETEKICKLKVIRDTGKASLLWKYRVYIDKFFVYLKERGLKVALKKVRNRIFYKILEKPQNYNKWFLKNKVSKDEITIQSNARFEYQPIFSIIVPLYETKEKYIKKLIDSVMNQSYKNWQLCFSDGSKDKERLKKIISKYATDDRINYVAEKNGPLGIADNTNQAMSIAQGDYIVLGDHDDLFAQDALFECAKLLNERKYEIIYTDEDKVDAKGKKHFDPNFKPDYNIDLLRSNNYICHMFVVAKEVVDKIGGFDCEYDGAQDYDFILRCVELAKSIGHIPKVLYHWRTHNASTASSPEAKRYAFEAGKRALEAHYRRLGIRASVESTEEWGFYKTNYEIIGNPKVSIIIPNKDHIDDLQKCIDAIDNLSDYDNYEYIIVENNSTEPATFEYYESISNRQNVKVLYWDKEFNYSAINNFGVKEADGEYILLLNNDTEIINKDCISQMLSYCQRDEVGIVGARLYYEDGSIQHAGVVVGIGGIAGHAFAGLYEEKGLYMSRTKVACDYSAVTAACLMVKKQIFDEVGGLDEEFKVAFNDIDFCMKVREKGKLVVYNPNAKLYHYESKSRGYEDTPEKQERFLDEIERFASKWAEILDKGDPFYNVNLTLNKNDFSIIS